MDYYSKLLVSLSSSQSSTEEFSDDKLSTSTHHNGPHKKHKKRKNKEFPNEYSKPMPKEKQWYEDHQVINTKKKKKPDTISSSHRSFPKQGRNEKEGVPFKNSKKQNKSPNKLKYPTPDIFNQPKDNGKLFLLDKQEFNSYNIIKEERSSSCDVSSHSPSEIKSPDVSRNIFQNEEIKKRKKVLFDAEIENVDKEFDDINKYSYKNEDRNEIEIKDHSLREYFHEDSPKQQEEKEADENYDLPSDLAAKELSNSNEQPLKKKRKKKKMQFNEHSLLHNLLEDSGKDQEKIADEDYNTHFDLGENELSDRSEESLKKKEKKKHVKNELHADIEKKNETITNYHQEPEDVYENSYKTENNFEKEITNKDTLAYKDINEVDVIDHSLTEYPHKNSPEEQKEERTDENYDIPPDLAAKELSDKNEQSLKKKRKKKNIAINDHSLTESFYENSQKEEEKITDENYNTHSNLTATELSDNSERILKKRKKKKKEKNENNIDESPNKGDEVDSKEPTSSFIDTSHESSKIKEDRVENASLKENLDDDSDVSQTKLRNDSISDDGSFDCNVIDEGDEEVDIDVLLEKYMIQEQNRIQAQKDLLQHIFIVVDWEIPEAHMFENSITTCPKKDLKKRIEASGIPIKKGAYNKKEDTIIKSNWNEFSELYNIHDPSIFFSFKHSMSNPIIPLEERIKFAQFLGKGLNDRLLFSIYQRFKVLFSKINKGRFTPVENKIIVTYMKHRSETKFAELAKILNRDRIALAKHYENIKGDEESSQPITWTLKNMEKLLKSLINNTNVKNYKKLRNIKITQKIWNRVSKEVNVHPKKLVHVWENKLAPRLFIKDTINITVIIRTFIDYLYEKRVKDWKMIDWEYLVTFFPGLTTNWMNKYLRDFLRSHTPHGKDSLKESAVCLRKSLDKYENLGVCQVCTHKHSPLVKLKFKNGHLFQKSSTNNGYYPQLTSES